MRLEQQQEQFDRARRTENKLTDSEQRKRADEVREATKDTFSWATRYTKTFNQFWREQKRSGPWEPFPDWPFFPTLFEYLESDDSRVKLIEKSRTMMATWAITAYFTLQCQLVDEREVIIQTMTDDKGSEIITYAKQLYNSQPQWLKDEFPLPKPTDKQPSTEFRIGSSVMHVIPSGVGKVRTYHPWGVFSDETAFQPEAGIAFDEAMAAGTPKIVLNSTAALSWYFDHNNDAEMT
jgi:hypothetical protein